MLNPVVKEPNPKIIPREEKAYFHQQQPSGLAIITNSSVFIASLINMFKAVFFTQTFLHLAHLV
jgi:hypothetical protein